MAANTAANVLVGATGHVYGAPTGTTLPTTEVAALDGAFVNQGYISDAGVVQGIAENITDIAAWGGDIVRSIATQHKLTFTFTMIETNAESLETFYGPQTTPLTTTEIKAQSRTRQSWVIDVVDGTIGYLRLVIPDGEVLEVGDVTYATESAISYEVTLTAYADTSGVKAYKYVHGNAGS